MPRIGPAGLGPSCELRVTLDRRFDLPALRGLRRAIADSGDLSRLELDFSPIRWLDAAALRLLADDLTGIEARGTHVVVRRLPAEMARRLARHPLRRFTGSGDDIFLDPDRERPGFLPSDR